MEDQELDGKGEEGHAAKDGECYAEVADATEKGRHQGAIATPTMFMKP